MTAATISREEAESKLRALGLNTEPAIQRSLDNPAAEIAALEPWAPHHGARAQKVEILRAYMRGKQTSTEPPDFRAPIDPGDPIVTAEQAEATLGGDARSTAHQSRREGLRSRAHPRPRRRAHAGDEDP